MRTTDGRFAASAQIEGMAATLFVIDTAGACSLTPAFVERNTIAASRDASTFIAPATRIDGRTATLRYARSGATVPPAAAGTIGACLLPDVVMVFDAPRQRLSLYGAALQGRRLIGPRALPLVAQRMTASFGPPVLAVPVRLNNAEGLAILSTGTQRSVINRRFAAAAGIDTPQEAGASTLDVAGRAHDQFAVAIDDGARLALRGFADQPVMILGLDILAQYRLVIDYPRDRVWFDRQ